MEEIEALDARRTVRRKGISVQELRLVVFGHGWLEKSRTGNTILQQQMFDTRRDVKMCVRRQTSDQKGRRIIVVNTPDRWIQYNVQYPCLVCDSVAECVSLCQPGPHAFLMVVPLGLNKGREWTVEAPLQILNDNLWKNTMVIFTKPEKLKGISIEDYTAKVKFLMPLLEKCGHRYHLLDTSFYGQESQVEELLEKINAMVDDKGKTQEVGMCNDVEAFLINQKVVEEKAKLRLKSAQTSRNVLRSIIGMRGPPSDHHILIVGPKGTGKSSTGNAILCHDAFQTSHSTSRRSIGRAEAGKKKATVVDTPGWHCRYRSQGTPFEELQEISSSNNSDLPNAVLLVLRCDESFTETDRLKTEERMILLGDWVWSKTLVLFTHKDKLGATAIEEHIERWPALQWLLDKCGNRYHVLNNLDRNDQIQVSDLLEKTEELEVLNDNHYLLQSYMQFQERYTNLDANCEELEIELKKRKAENEKLKEILEEKDCMVNNLTQTMAKKDDAVCAYKNTLEDANSRLQSTVFSLENAERNNEQLKECLKEKGNAIAGLLGEKEKAQKSIALERAQFYTKLKETKDHMEMELIKLEEENQQLKTENECSKMMLKSVAMEVQQHFKKKYNLQRKMEADMKTLQMLSRLGNEEERTTFGRDSCKPNQDAHQPCEITKKWLVCSSSLWPWMMAGGAALGAVVGGSWAEGGIRLNMGSPAGAAAGALLGLCWIKKNTRTESAQRETTSETDVRV